MQKSISLGSGFDPRRALVPAALSLVVAGAAGAYAFGNDPGDAMPPRQLALQPASVAVSYAPDPSLNNGFAAISPPQAAQALQQVAALTVDPAPASQSFASAFAPMTVARVKRQPVVALHRDEAPPPVAEPAPKAEPNPPAKPQAAPPPVAAEPAQAEAVVVPAAAPVADPVPLAQAEAPPLAQAEPVPQAEPQPVAAVAPVPEPTAAPRPEPASLAASEPEPEPEPAPPPVKQETELAVAAVPAVPGAAAAPVDPTPAKLVTEPASQAPVPLSATASASTRLVTPAATPALTAPAAAPKALAPTASPKPVASLAKATARGKVKPLAGPQIPSRYKLVEGGVETRIGVQMYGERLGAVPLRVLGNGVPSLQLGDLLALVRSRLAPEQFERLSGSAAADEYVSLETLRKAGIPVRYDAARDELKLGEE